MKNCSCFKEMLGWSIVQSGSMFSINTSTQASRKMFRSVKFEVFNFPFSAQLFAFVIFFKNSGTPVSSWQFHANSVPL